MSSKPLEPDGILTTNVAASDDSVANRWAQALDVAAFVLNYRPFLKAMAASEFPDHLKSRCDDSDLVQETLLKATQHRDQFCGRSAAELEAWLREILLNQITDVVRFHARQQRDINAERSMPTAEVPSTDPSASTELQSVESRERIWKAVNALPENHRTVILLRMRTDLSFAEIGTRMNRSADAVRMLWGRGIVMLGEKLAE